MVVRFILCLLLVVAVLQWHTLRARQSWSATVDETCYLTHANITVHLRRLDPQLVAFGVAPLPILVQWLPTMWNQPSALRNNYWQGTLTDPAKINRARWLTSWLVGNGLLITICGWIAYRRGHYWGAAAGLLIGDSPHIITYSSLATTDVLATWMWLVCLAVYAWSWRGMSLITIASCSSRAKVDEMRAKSVTAAATSWNTTTRWLAWLVERRYAPNIPEPRCCLCGVSFGLFSVFVTDGDFVNTMPPIGLQT